MKAKLNICKTNFKDEIESFISRGKLLLENAAPSERAADAYYGNVRRGLSACQKQYIAEVTNWKKEISEFLSTCFDQPENEYLSEFDHAGIRLIYTSNQDYIELCKEELGEKINVLHSLLTRLRFIISNSVEETLVIPQSNDSKNVFIVHGHDDALRSEVELFIRQLGYHPIVLSKEANKGQTIIEKIEDKSTDVAFAIVLYTDCDLGKDKNDNGEYRFRARQNVVFEHGYMCAKLGRNRVCALVKDDVEIPGDLNGIVYISVRGQWKIQIAKEMKAADLKVDLNNIIDD